MIDILLINPPFKNYGIEKNSIADLITLGSSYPPLGLLYIASACENTGFDVQIFRNQNAHL